MNATKVKTFFEATAAEWDTMRLTYYDERVIETLADAIAVDSAQNVLDVGTGTGFVAAGIDNVELREGDLVRLPLEDDSIDAAVANMVLHHAEDPAGMLAEMTRVVRPGGRVAIADEIEHPYEWMRTEQADVWLGFTPDQVEGFFGSARLSRYGYAPLGSQ